MQAVKEALSVARELLGPQPPRDESLSGWARSAFAEISSGPVAQQPSPQSWRNANLPFAVAQLEPPPPIVPKPPPTWSETGQQAVRSAGGTLAGMATAPLRGLDMLISAAVPKEYLRFKTPEEMPASRFAKYAETLVNNVLPAEQERAKGTFLGDILPSNIAAMFGMMAGGGAISLATRLPGLASAAAIGSGMGAVEAYKRARERGASVDTSLKAAGLSGIVGTTEGIPLGKMIDRMTGGMASKGVKEAVRVALGEAGEETVQNTLQQVGDNYVAKSLYDPSQDTFEGLEQAAASGGIVGFIASIGASMLGAKARRRTGLSKEAIAKGAEQYAESNGKEERREASGTDVQGVGEKQESDDLGIVPPSTPKAVSNSPTEAFAAANPDLARTLAKQPELSRADAAAMGVERSSKKQRAAIHSQLKEAVAGLDAPPPTAVPAVAEAPITVRAKPGAIATTQFDSALSNLSSIMKDANKAAPEQKIGLLKRAAGAFRAFIEGGERGGPLTPEDIASSVDGRGGRFTEMARVIRSLPAWIRVRPIEFVEGRAAYADAGNNEVGWIWANPKTTEEGLIHELGHHVFDSLPADARAEFHRVLSRYRLEDLYSGPSETIKRYLSKYGISREAAGHELFAMGFQDWAGFSNKTANFKTPPEVAEFVRLFLNDPTIAPEVIERPRPIRKALPAPATPALPVQARAAQESPRPTIRPPTIGEATPAVEPSKPTASPIQQIGENPISVYGGKAVEIDYGGNANERFKRAAQRVHDNSGEGYVVSKDKNGAPVVHKITKSSKMAKRVSGEEAVAAINSATSLSKSAPSKPPPLPPAEAKGGGDLRTYAPSPEHLEMQEGKAAAIMGLEKGANPYRKYIDEQMSKNIDANKEYSRIYEMMHNWDSGYVSVHESKRGTGRTGIKPPRPESMPPTMGGAEKARAELNDAIDDFGNYLKGKTFSTPLDPELYTKAAVIVGKAVKAGVLTFKEFIQTLAGRIGAGRVRKLGPSLRQAWSDAKRRGLRVDTPPDDIEPFLAGIDEGDAEIPAGRPELANPTDNTVARGMTDAVDSVREMEGVPETKSDAQANAEADALMQDEPATRAKILNAARTGGQLNDAETIAAKRILSDEWIDAVTSGDITAIGEVVELAESYRATGTEQARAFRQRRDPVESPEKRRERLLGEALLSPPKSAQGKPEAVKQWAEQVPKIVEKLVGFGIDISKPEEWAASPVKAVKALQAVAQAKATPWDMAYEYWRNAILSAPQTHVVNTLGNATHAVWSLTAEWLAKAIVNDAAFKHPDAPTLGEFRYMLQGMLPSLSLAARNAALSWDTETPWFEHSMGREGHARIEEANTAIPGKSGRVLRAPQRAMLAADEFAKTIIAHTIVGAHAYRIAKSRGATGEQMAQMINGLIANPNSNAWDAALSETREITFQSDPGKVGNLALVARKDLPGIRYILPFVVTPANIFKTGLRKSPLGAVALAARIAKAVKTGDWSKVPERVAEQLIAWGVALLLMSNDPDDPWITGAAGQHNRGKRELSERTSPAQSIKLGDRWYSYARIEPFATALAAGVDLINQLRSTGATPETSAATFNSLVGQVKDKTFLAGISDIMEAVQSEGSAAQRISEWATRFSTSWVPNLIRSTGRAMDDSRPERGVWAQGQERVSRIIRRAAQGTETGLVADRPKVDVWGRDVSKSGSPVPYTDFLFRLLSPVQSVKTDRFNADRALAVWNSRNPDEAYYPLAPGRSVTIKGVVRYMTDDEYERFARAAGQEAVRILGNRKINAENPTERDIEVIRSALEVGRATARSRLIKEIRSKQ